MYTYLCNCKYSLGRLRRWRNWSVILFFPTPWFPTSNRCSPSWKSFSISSMMARCYKQRELPNEVKETALKSCNHGDTQLSTLFSISHIFFYISHSQLSASCIITIRTPTHRHLNWEGRGHDHPTVWKSGTRGYQVQDGPDSLSVSYYTVCYYTNLWMYKWCAHHNYLSSV